MLSSALKQVGGSGSVLQFTSPGIFNYFASTFGNSFDGSYLAIFVPFTRDGKAFTGGEWTNSVGISTQGDSAWLAHALFHRWDAWMFGVDLGWDARWLDEGLADWYSAALPARLRLNPVPSVTYWTACSEITSATWRST